MIQSSQSGLIILLHMLRGECACKSNPNPSQAFCPICGSSQENLQLVNEVAFMNQGVVGTFGSQSGTHSNFRGFAKDLRLKKAQKFGKIIGTELNLSQLQQQQGMRLFKWAQHNNFTHGRHTSHVMATCLYIVCRQQKTPHLLIDFADTLGINLYQLGATFLKMANLLHFEGEKLPIIDPSLFIHRFCNRLDFGEQQNQVAITALKLLGRMKRDWMCYGRRPTSLCGAAILIAARYHGFKRTTGQIVLTVRVCDETIRKRLEEFKETQVAKLTREEFERLDLEKDLEEENDPPSFRRALKKSNRMISRINNIEESLAEKAQLIETELQQSPPAEEQTEPLPLPQEQPVLPQVTYQPTDYSDVHLSDISDTEIDQLILSPEEKTLKSIMWHKMHKDWLQEQLIKKQLKDKQKKSGKRRHKKVNQLIDAADAVTAISQFSRLKDKVNHEVLQEVFDFDVIKKHKPDTISF